jgi:drug/metabolite transporter (DMT)-like permease
MSQAPLQRSEAAAYRLAVVLILVSSLGFSLNGLIVRSLHEATSWQLLFWRGLGVASGQLLILLWAYRATLPVEFARIGRWGLVASALNGTSPAGFFFALGHATLANVVFLLSAMPFVSAIVARLVLKERIQKQTLIAIPIAFVGIAIMVAGSIAAGAWLGNLLALVTGGAVMVPLHDIVLCFGMGSVITGFGHVMFMKAAQILPAAEVTFLMLIEFVLAPVWVWLLVNEVPRPATLIGGGIVLATVTGWAYQRMRGGTAGG